MTEAAASLYFRFTNHGKYANELVHLYSKDNLMASALISTTMENKNFVAVSTKKDLFVRIITYYFNPNNYEIELDVKLFEANNYIASSFVRNSICCVISVSNQPIKFIDVTHSIFDSTLFKIFSDVFCSGISSLPLDRILIIHCSDQVDVEVNFSLFAKHSRFLTQTMIDKMFKDNALEVSVAIHSESIFYVVSMMKLTHCDINILHNGAIGVFLAIDYFMLEDIENEAVSQFQLKPDQIHLYIGMRCMKTRCIQALVVKFMSEQDAAFTDFECIDADDLLEALRMSAVKPLHASC